MTVQEKTSSCNSKGRGYCGKRFFLCMTRTFLKTYALVFVDKSCIACGRFVGNVQYGDLLGSKTEFSAFRVRQSRRCGEFWLFDRWENQTNAFGLSNGGCGEKMTLQNFPQGCGEFVHTFREPVLSKKGCFSRKQGKFGELHKVLHIRLCKTSFFHTVFHNLWKSRGTIHSRCGERVEKPWEKAVFSTSVQRATDGRVYQLPLISLIISSSSVRKTGFWTIRFSMVSREERTVEWSRSIILPILGRDISVIWRMM